MSLQLFDPLVRDWFRERLGDPTEVQRLAWPEIAAGRHLLITAPTGTGKTLAATLWAIDRLATGAWEPGRLRVLYVSPLKALNHDVERNLTRPLVELEARFRAAGRPWPGLRVAVRTGDTPAAERQRLVRHPPEILITTPESLNLLLGSRGGRAIFPSLATVILDEIHAVAGSRRGTHLATAIERLVPLAGEFQRLALSATVRPLRRVAELVGGFERAGEGESSVYRRREVRILEVGGEKRYELEVRSLFGDEEPDLESLWPRLAEELRLEVGRHRSTLLFTNSRRHAERLTRAINEAAGAELATSHHGSLSREIRSEVERRLKEGRLPALVATSSLELGIDVGDLEAVVLVQTPRSLASAIQRIGRAGHGVGAPSRGIFYPLHGRDLLEAAVATRAVLEQRVEPLVPVNAPLDVLAQVLLSMLAVESWELAELYAQIRTAAPYRDLARRTFDRVIEMLAGRFADARVAELAPRIVVDALTGRAAARPGAARLVAQAGGTIPDRGYFTLRVDGSLARLGELDEEFVWERKVGDCFVLGAQAWRIRQITHNDVLVTPAPRSAAAIAPFWRADARDRDFTFSEARLELLAEAAGRLDDPSWTEQLQRERALTPSAAAALIRTLRLQRAATGELPHRRRLVIERCDDVAGRSAEARERVFLHTGWGGRVNRPFALALEALWGEVESGPLEVALDDDCVLLTVPAGADVVRLLSRLAPERIEELLRQALDRSGFFGARFRECAGRALLLPRAGYGSRTPLWLSRQRAKQLLAAVSRFGDFPLVLETWRTCLEEEFDLESLQLLLGDFAAGRLAVVETRTAKPSPFASGLLWRQTNELMYEDDVPLPGSGGRSISANLLREVVFSPAARPRLSEALLGEVRAKSLRLAPGYAPTSAEELHFWVQERLMVPLDEWDELLAAMERDAAEPVAPWLVALGERLLCVRLPGASIRSVVALERLSRVTMAVEDRDELRVELLNGAGRIAPTPEGSGVALAELLEEWLRPVGPVSRERLAELFGGRSERLDEAIDELLAASRLVQGAFRENTDCDEVCHPDRLEILLRWKRAESRSSLEARPAADLPPFLALHQGLVGRGEGMDGLERRIEQLLGFPAPAAAWETEILPARLSPYFPSWLDSAMQQSDLLWVGCERARLAFAFPEDLRLLHRGERRREDVESPLLPPPGARADTAEIARRAGTDVASAAAALWELAWQGAVANDTYLAVRRGLASDFEPPRELDRGRVSASRAAAGRFRSAARPFPGHWVRVPWPDELGEDPIAADALDRERARLLLHRYGVVFRELLAQELPAFEWRRISRALRLMELGGEVLAGQFFLGVPGLQFASREAFRRLREEFVSDTVYWLAATDPASLCGLEIAGLKETLPRRERGSHLVFLGRDLVLISRRSGRELTVRLAPDHPRLDELWAPFSVRLARHAEPERAIDIERINDEPAARSAFADRLARVFSLTREGDAIRLRRSY